MPNANMQIRCYFGCAFNPPLHSFPSPHYPNEGRFAKWKSILNEDIINRGDEYIHRNVRLCERHFEEKYKTRGRRLTLNSYPTLHLSFNTSAPAPDTLPSVESAVLTLSSIETAIAPVPAALPSVESAVSTLPLPAHPRTAVIAKENEHQNEDQISSASVQDILIKSRCQEPKKLKKRNKFYSSKTKESKELAKLKVKLLKAKAKCKTFRQRVRKAEKITKSKYFLKTIEQLPEPAFLFTKMQYQFKKQARGRRFSINEKVLALTLFKQSQKAYNLMRKLFVLPSKRTLQKTLNLIPLKPGINDFIIKNIRETVKKFSDEKKLCTLIFDEVALTPGLYYSRYLDQIEGFEDFGDKRTGKIADHALVFMIKGIKSKYKQPICFTFCQSSTKKEQLKTQIKEVVKQLTSTGLKIIATVCDQGGPNMSAINSLVAETKEKYERNKEEYRSLAFEVEEIKVFPIYDPPHLLKGIRNNLLNKRLRYIQNGNVKFANWHHLRLLLDIDIGDGDDDDTRFCNKITELHINEEKIPKMKVKYAAQVFSQRVSSSLRFVAKHKLLPQECTETADLLLIMDKLFDSFNGHSYKEQDKKYKNCLKKHSPHHHLWDELLPILRSMQFEVIKKNGEKKYEQVPSIKNWIHNIKVMKELFNHLNATFNITSLLTRNLNQDPLENFFCCIRSHGVRNISPTCSQFNSAYKTLLVNNFSSAHAVGANCENDINKPLQSLQHLLISSNEPQLVEVENESQVVEIDNIIDILEGEESVSLISDESKRYVGGYIIKKCRKIYGKCKICNKDISSKPSEDSYIYARDYTKKSLNYPSNAMHKCISEILKLTNRTLSLNPQNKNTIENIKLLVETTSDFSFLSCSMHKQKLTTFFVRLAITINVHSWCTCVNRILKGKVCKINQEDITKVQAEKYYKTHKNRKNKK